MTSTENRGLLAALTTAGHTVDHLRPATVRPGLAQYWADLVQRRHFIWRDSRSRSGTQYAGTFLGRLWFFLMPLIDAVFYWLIFGVVLGVSRGMDNFVAYVIVGVLMFRSTARVMNSATVSLRSSRAMIRAFVFPRASVPISAVLRELLAVFPMVAVMLVLIIAIPPGVEVGVMWLLMPFVLVLQAGLNLGLALWLARLGHMLPDLSRVISVAVRFLMYGSGVIFPIDRFLTMPLVKTICDLNPIFQMLTAYRSLLIHNEMPPASTWATLIVWVVVLVSTGFVFFWRGEPTYGR
ncbi:ABC transporter permease [Helcobacillus massiliensis]|uniref:ABC transporter permease n=1 Tax=Helcobacillus massiliensis TaxID=521392 RepID=UPI0021A3520B|nr:ABC transporter permease [Helcobacillus massiliensis]MCT1557627.1 ABC transporter permease [Helcobacillus massiliensis]MCT2035899.1 ABC transporter permease [Helcobacillus massiliensis]MCT2331831.1 ABC transporter permease [Helcobacillus massiliensis]